MRSLPDRNRGKTVVPTNQTREPNGRIDRKSFPFSGLFTQVSAIAMGGEKFPPAPGSTTYDRHHTVLTMNSLTVNQTTHRLVCEALRGVLRPLAQAGPDAVDEIGSILYRVSAVVYTLLLDHPIDRRGRCRSCRRPGAIVGLRRRPCRIYLKASYWLLRQPDGPILFSHLADDLGLGTAPASGAGVPQPPTNSGGSLVITGGIPWPR